jgi:hypothetical protein
MELIAFYEEVISNRRRCQMRFDVSFDRHEIIG